MRNSNNTGYHAGCTIVNTGSAVYLLFFSQSDTFSVGRLTQLTAEFVQELVAQTILRMPEEELNGHKENLMKNYSTKIQRTGGFLDDLLDQVDLYNGLNVRFNEKKMGLLGQITCEDLAKLLGEHITVVSPGGGS